MTKKIYHWELNDDSNDSSIMRYCHNCGRKVVFKDSKKRRRNANGKTIFEYAIYKCEKDHTWNLPLGTYKPSDIIENNRMVESADKKCNYDILNLKELKNEGIIEIRIILEEVTGKWRIDKLLADRIKDYSRTKICEFINLAYILLDGKAASHDTLLRKKQTITIMLDNLF